MEIRFNNRSKIDSINENIGCDRGVIRGRRLTDEEFWKVIYDEQTQTENNVDKILKELRL